MDHTFCENKYDRKKLYLLANYDGVENYGNYFKP